MRVMFVDDERRVLAGLERTVFMADRDWDCVFAASGAEALELLDAEPADVVVSDMRMPMMDGGQLLRQVRERWPGTIRIILSGHTEQETALRCLNVAHQCLAKPCEGERLIEAIDRSVSLQRLLADRAVQAVVGRVGGLPSTPSMFARLNALLGEGEGNVGEVARTVRSDPALAAKVLQLANCAYFGAAHAISSIDEAVERVGVTMLRCLVLVNEVFVPPDDVDVGALRVRAVIASELAAEIAESPASKDVATTAALLAQVGLLLPQIQRHCAQVEAGEHGAPTHAEVGAYLLGMWGLPGRVVEAVAHHLAPWRVKHQRFDGVGATHVAVALATGRDPDQRYLQRMGVAAKLPQWRQSARRHAAEGGGLP